ncbi:hypothetical protein M970_050770 [Encephalitozoon cuniculi EcunIII-L]|nr:hypothetical protein M970_050770 [Encephalitozoon cuniculi EcunIII-L]UYI27872.1 hypothetical protein J0A71_08g17600 [Encephalitozoon cuniculi]
MLRLYEGMVFLPSCPPDCTFVQIIHHETIEVQPGEEYPIPVFLSYQAVFANLCIHEGKASLMTVNYIQAYTSSEENGVLSYREFQGVEITKQRTLKSEIYEVLPPFGIREYFDGAFLFFRLEKLFGGDEVKGYELHSEKNEYIERRGSIYKAYPGSRHSLEYSISGENFMYRFRSRCVSGCPFHFRLWSASDVVYFTARPQNSILEVECPGIMTSDTSKGTISIPLDQLRRQGGFLCVGGYRIGFLPEFHMHHSDR